MGDLVYSWVITVAVPLSVNDNVTVQLSVNDAVTALLSANDTAIGFP